jgi:hypothetical protein
MANSRVGYPQITQINADNNGMYFFAQKLYFIIDAGDFMQYYYS